MPGMNAALTVAPVAGVVHADGGGIKVVADQQVTQAVEQQGVRIVEPLPVDECGVDGRPGRRVILAYRVCVFVGDEQMVLVVHRQASRVVQSLDKVGVDRRPGRGVVLADDVVITVVAKK